MNQNGQMERPVKKPPVLYQKTQQLIKEIEQHLDARLICYWNSPNGEVCGNDVFVLYELLKKISPQKKIYLFLKSFGGNGQASLRLVHLLHQYASNIVALVPLECSSAATMIALGCNQIQMGPLAYLSAVDTSLTHKLNPVDRNNYTVSVSQDELSRVIKLWNDNTEKGENQGNPYQALYGYVHPLVIGAVDRASSLSIKLCQEILSYHMEDKEKIGQISHQLNSDYPSHSYPITLREANNIGLNANPLDHKVNELLLKLNVLYSEMGQRAYTDYDETNYHDNEILNIFESSSVQVYYQVDKDWHYRAEERRWVPLNDQSSWRKIEEHEGELFEKILHIR